MSLLFKVAFLLAVSSASEACSCEPIHPQEYFCYADVGELKICDGKGNDVHGEFRYVDKISATLF